MLDHECVGIRFEVWRRRGTRIHMQRFYVRLNAQGQPSFLTRHDDPNHTPIALQDLPGKLRNLVVRIYGEFSQVGADLSGRARTLKGPVVIEWPEGHT